MQETIWNLKEKELKQREDLDMIVGSREDFEPANPVLII